MEQMDVDSLNSPPETQVGFMNMMLQLQQLALSSEARLPQTHQFSTAPMHTFQTSPTTTASPIFCGPLDRTTTPMLNNLTPIGNAGPSTQSCLFLAHRPISTSAMREMVFLTAAMQPICVDPESVKRPKRRNVRISKEPQSVAARLRRERISERMRTLQRMVPGGTKMDTASMLDQAIHYVKFLKTQVQSLERAVADRSREVAGQPPTAAWMTSDSYRARFWDM